MTKVFSALATSVDGYITGLNLSPDQPLGEGCAQLFAWYADGDMPSTQFPDFRMSASSQAVLDVLAARTGAAIAGSTIAPLFVLSHRLAPAGSDGQTFVASGIADAIEAAARVPRAARTWP